MYIHNANQNTHTSTLWHSSQTVIVIMLTIGCIFFLIYKLPIWLHCWHVFSLESYVTKTIRKFSAVCIADIHTQRVGGILDYSQHPLELVSGCANAANVFIYCLTVSNCLFNKEGHWTESHRTNASPSKTWSVSTCTTELKRAIYTSWHSWMWYSQTLLRTLRGT